MIFYRETARFDQNAAVVFITKEQVKNKKFNFKHKSLEKEILTLAAEGQFEAGMNQFYPLMHSGKFFLLAGFGESGEQTATAIRACVRKALLSSFLNNKNSVEIIPSASFDTVITGIIEGIGIGTYSWKKYKSRPKAEKSEATRKYTIIASKKKIYDETELICEGATLTRNLVNDNADVVNSLYFERVIKDLVKGKPKLKLEVLGEKEMAKKGLNLHLAVNQGSKYPPRLIIVKYQGAPQDKNFVALVGKGMTYDTGGLNLKTSGHIESMRTDMSGAAAVVGVLKNTLSLSIKKNVLFVCVLAENAIDANSYKPGDVFRSYSGKTVEIANTDAEGRLVLADAISYVIRNYNPQQIIDIATLTGACVVALGHDYTGLMTNDDELSRCLVRSSNETDDRVWRMPIYKELRDAVKSQIADIKNLGFSKGAAGAMTAAEFLRQFVEDKKWAHLDIAGTAFVDNQERFYYAHGATGAGVRLLTHYLKNY